MQITREFVMLEMLHLSMKKQKHKLTDLSK